MFSELAEFSPVIAGIPLKNDNIKILTLMLQILKKVKQDKSVKYSDESGKYDNVLNVVKEKYPIYENKLIEYEDSNSF